MEDGVGVNLQGPDKYTDVRGWGQSLLLNQRLRGAASLENTQL